MSVEGDNFIIVDFEEDTEDLELGDWEDPEPAPEPLDDAKLTALMNELLSDPLQSYYRYGGNDHIARRAMEDFKNRIVEEIQKGTTHG